MKSVAIYHFLYFYEKHFTQNGQTFAL